MAGETGELAFVATMRDEATKVAQSARKSLDSVGGETKPIVAALKVDADQAKREVDGLEKTTEGLPEKFKDDGDKSGKGLGEGILGGLSGMKGKILGAIAAIGIGEALSESLDIDAANDKLAASLGATPAIAKRYGDMASRIYSGAWGDSVEDVDNAIAAVKTSISGLGSGKLLEDATTQALNFATIFDVDVTRAAASAGGIIKSGLAKNATQAFDIMTAASQRVPVQLREDVLDASDEYSQFFASLGFSGPQAFGMLAAGAAKGMYGIDKAGDAIKEFTIRSTDMSTSSVAAYDAIGLDAQTMANKILAGGKTARGATQEIVKGILSIRDPAKRANTAIALFGTPLEDINVRDIPAFLKSMISGEKGLGRIEGASKRAGTTLNDNARTNLTSFARQAKQAFVNVIGGQAIPKIEEIASTLATNFGPALSVVGDLISKTTGFLKDHTTTAGILAGVIGTLAAVTAAHSAVLAVSAAGGMLKYLQGTKLISAATKVWTAVQWAMNAALWASPTTWIIAGIIALIAIIVLAVKHWDAIKRVIVTAWDAIKSATGTAVSAIVGFVKNHWLLLLGILTGPFGLAVALIVKYWDAIKSGVSSAVNAIRGVIGKAFGVIAAIIRTYVAIWRTIITTAWNVIRTYVSTVIGVIRSVVSAGFAAVRSVISSAMATAKSLVSSAWGAIQSAVSGGIGKVVSLAKSLPEKIASGLGNLKDLLLSAGGDVVQGLIDGITDRIGDAVAKAKELAGAVAKAAKGALGIHSPSKVFKEIAAWTVKGFVKGLDDGREEVEKTIDRVFGRIGDYFADKYPKNADKAKRATRKVLAALKDEAKAVRANASEHDRRMKILDKMKASYDKAVQVSKDYAAGMREAALDFAAVTSIDTVNDAPLTAGFIAKGLEERLAAIVKYRKDLATLRSRHVDGNIIKELESQGVSGGSAAAAALAHATNAQLAEINQTQGKIEAEASTLGKQAADAWYKTGVDAAAGLVRGAAAALRDVDRIGRQLARQLRAAVRKELGIKSPSRRLAEDGRHTAAGLAVGLLEGAREAEAAARTMADRVGAAAIPTLPDLAALANATALRAIVVRSENVVTIRHEVVSPDGSVSDMTAAEIADLIARDPKSAKRIEAALKPARRRRDGNTISASD